VAREGVLRQRAARYYRQGADMKIVKRIFMLLILAWGCVLAAHWLWLSTPRWLVVLHTIVYAVVSIFWLAAMLFVTIMARRQRTYLRPGD
jgi:hypothetical protein